MARKQTRLLVELNDLRAFDADLTKRCGGGGARGPRRAGRAGSGRRKPRPVAHTASQPVDVAGGVPGPLRGGAGGGGPQHRPQVPGGGAAREARLGRQVRPPPPPRLAAAAPAPRTAAARRGARSAAAARVVAARARRSLTCDRFQLRLPPRHAASAAGRLPRLAGAGGGHRDQVCVAHPFEPQGVGLCSSRPIQGSVVRPKVVTSVHYCADTGCGGGAAARVRVALTERPSRSSAQRVHLPRVPRRHQLLRPAHKFGVPDEGRQRPRVDHRIRFAEATPKLPHADFSAPAQACVHTGTASPSRCRRCRRARPPGSCRARLTSSSRRAALLHHPLRPSTSFTP